MLIYIMHLINARSMDYIKLGYDCFVGVWTEDCLVIIMLFKAAFI
jgi:hypothetical protein